MLFADDACTKANNFNSSFKEKAKLVEKQRECLQGHIEIIKRHIVLCSDAGHLYMDYTINEIYKETAIFCYDGLIRYLHMYRYSTSCLQWYVNDKIEPTIHISWF